MLFFLLLHFICFIFRCYSQMNLCRRSRRLPMTEGALNSSAWTYHKLHSHIRSCCTKKKKQREEKKQHWQTKSNKLNIRYSLLYKCVFFNHILSCKETDCQTETADILSRVRKVSDVVGSWWEEKGWEERWRGVEEREIWSSQHCFNTWAEGI